ncbi:MAG: hypothetical protein ACRDTZ_01100 [Pseudonocardiaceae bacterium]
MSIETCEGDGNGLTVTNQHGMTSTGYSHQHRPAVQRLSDVDSWVAVLASTAQLAEQICDTEFVPKEMRGSSAAVTAAILTGRELGIGPMTSLAHIHIVKGKPGQSAQLMRQLVLAAGHQIQYLETSDSRCIVTGRRKGEDKWEQVSFTSEQARKARIDLGGYPEDKLVARATSRLCRRKFADCLGGMAYAVEELEDGVLDTTERRPEPSSSEQPAAPAQPARRTAQRRTQPRNTPTQQSTPEPDATESAGPPLPSEAEYDEPGGTHTPADSKPASSAQTRKLFAILGEGEIHDRDMRLAISSRILERDMNSWNELTSEDANILIDVLEPMAGQGPLAEVFPDLPAAGGPS